MIVTNIEHKDQLLSVQGNITITFDQLLRQTTVNKNSIYIEYQDGTEQSGITYEYEVNPDNVVVNYRGLLSDTDYRLVVKKYSITYPNGIRSLDDQTLQEDYIYNFSTKIQIQDENTDVSTQYQQDIDNSDLPINLFNETPTKTSVSYKINKTKYDGKITITFDRDDIVSNITNLMYIDIQDMYGNKIPQFVYYNTIDQNSVELIFKHVDGNELPKNSIIFINFDEDIIKNGEIIMFTELYPMPVNKYFIKRRLGNLSKKITIEDLNYYYQEQLIKYQDYLGQNFIKQYRGYTEQVDPSSLFQYPYINVNYNSGEQIQSYEVVENGKYNQNLFQNIIMQAVVENLHIKSSNIDSISFENANIRYSNQSQRNTYNIYQEKVDEIVKDILYNHNSPKGHTRTDSRNNYQIYNQANLYIDYIDRKRS